MQAQVKVFIFDSIYQSLPRPPFTDEDIEQASDQVYTFVWARSTSQPESWA